MFACNHNKIYSNMMNPFNKKENSHRTKSYKNMSKCSANEQTFLQQFAKIVHASLTSTITNNVIKVVELLCFLLCFSSLAIFSATNFGQLKLLI